jgi:hypothetical protein
MKLIQRYFLFFVSLTIITSLCFVNPNSVSAQSQAQDTISPPLLPSLTWKNLGSVKKDVNVYGQTLTLSGDMFEAIEKLQNGIPESVFDYYSKKNLQSLGWDFVGNTSFESAYWNPSGRYLVVQIMECADSQTDYCVNVWQSVDASKTPPVEQASAGSAAPLATFYKTVPANGSTIALPASGYRLLQWSDAGIGSTDRYQYCIDESNNSQCNSEWITRNSLYSNDSTVLGGHTYYWQVCVRDADICSNNNTWWAFYVQPGAVGPVVTSIVRASPTSSITNAARVSFTVTFNEAVTNVDISDFALATSGIAGAGIYSVTGSGTAFTVTVNTGSGNGAIHLDLIDNDSIKNGSNIPLGGSGAGNGTYTTGQTYTIDRTVPQVVSSVLVNPNPTNLASVRFTVTFSEAVANVDIADFSLTTTGIAGVSITSVSGSGATYSVTVSTGTGNGTLHLNVEDNDTILDAAGNKLGGPNPAGNGKYTAGQTYTIDKTVPKVVSSLFASPNPTNLSSVNFTVTFSEAVTGVDTADFSLTTTGITGAWITGVTGAGATRTVTVNTGTDNGTLRLNVADNDTILDLAGNVLGGASNGSYTAGQTYTIEKTVPTVISSVLNNLSLTNLPSVSFTVTFSEVVGNVDATDFSLSPTVTGAAITAVSGSGTTRTVTVSTGTGSGELRLNVADNDSIMDAAGNKLGGTGAGNGNFTAGQAYNIDRTAPKVGSSVRVNPNPSNLSSVNFAVTFTEIVTGVDAADFNLNPSVPGAAITNVSGSGATRTVTVSTGTGSGLLRLNVVDNGTILDILGYELGGAGAGNGNYIGGQYYTIDRAAPKVVSSVRINPSTTNLASVNFTVTFSEAVTNVDTADFSITSAGITGALVTAVNGSGTTRTVTVSTGTGNGTLRLNVIDNDTILDIMGYKLVGTSTNNGNYTAGETYTIDRTAPKVVSSVRVNPSPTNLASVNFTVTFSESVTDVDKTDFSLAPSIIGSSITTVSGSGTTRTVTVNTGTGNGTLRLNVIDNDTILDAAGNKLGGTGGGNGNYLSGQTYTIDKTTPDTIINTKPSAKSNSASATFTFSSTDATAAFECSLDSGAYAACVTPKNYAGLAQGSHTFKVRAKDSSNNVDASPASYTWTVDTIAPTVSSIVRAFANPTNAASVNFTVTFSEAVTAVDVADFNLTSTVTGASITTVSGSGTTRTVAVNTGTGSGTLRLNVTDNDTILDGTGNKLGGTGIGNGSYIAGQTYTIDKTAPTVSSIVRASTDLTNAASVNFTVTFSESVTGVDAADFSLNPTVTGASITTVSGSGTTRTVAVNTGTGDGSLRLNVIDNDTILDLVGNKLGGTNAGNGNYTSGQAYTIDKTAPNTQIDTAPAASSNSTSATFTFSSADGTATFECSLDGGSYAACTSGVTYNSLADGPHTFNVRAKDSANNVDSTPASHSWTVDATPPDTQIDTKPSDPSNSASTTFTFSSADGAATFECSLDSGAYATCTSPTNYTGLAEGSHTFNVRAMDLLNNVDASPASHTWTVDTTAPTVSSIVRASAVNPTNAASVDFTVTFSESVTGVDMADFTLNTAIPDASITGVTGSGTSYTVSVNTGSVSGDLRLDVVDDNTILDGVGNMLGGTSLNDGDHPGDETYTVNKP